MRNTISCVAYYNIFIVRLYLRFYGFSTDIQEYFMSLHVYENRLRFTDIVLSTWFLNTSFMSHLIFIKFNLQLTIWHVKMIHLTQWDDSKYLFQFLLFYNVCIIIFVYFIVHNLIKIIKYYWKKNCNFLLFRSFF